MFKKIILKFFKYDSTKNLTKKGEINIKKKDGI